MLVIQINGEPPEKWKQRAAEITAELEVASPDERQAIIDKNQKHWGKIKKWLLGQSHGKCWFSEAKEKYSYYHIEHFRPKDEAKNLDGSKREGYWWLSFDWHNYRIMGGVGNAKKGTFFPLKVGSPAANSNWRDIDCEMCYLLDPLREEDVTLITFDGEGLMKPLAGLSEWEVARVTETVRLLNLNEHEPLVEARRAIWQTCMRHINQFLDAQSKLGATQHQEAKFMFKSAIEHIRELTSNDSELSAVATACVLKQNIERLNKIVFSNKTTLAA
jgi:uncharacterized protein (TIGR02646 family)